jgi:hypothetical protein
MTGVEERSSADILAPSSAPRLQQRRKPLLRNNVDLAAAARAWGSPVPHDDVGAALKDIIHAERATPEDFVTGWPGSRGCPIWHGPRPSRRSTAR